MPTSSIELPLLAGQSVSGSGRGDGEEGGALAEAKALVARQRLLDKVSLSRPFVGASRFPTGD